MTESTEPPTAARDVIAQSLERQEPGTYDWTRWAQPIIDDLTAAGYTIAPIEPRRAVISVEAARCAKRALDDYLMAADIDYNSDAEQDARDEIAVAIAAAERALTEI